MLIDLDKYKLKKLIEAEIEKTVRFYDFLEAAAAAEDPQVRISMDRAVLRYYALLRRIDNLHYKQKAAGS